MGRSRAGLRMCICGWRRIFEGPCENHKIPTKIAPITTSQADLQKNTQQIRLFCRKHKRGMRGAWLAYVFDNSPVAEVSGRLDEIGGEDAYRNFGVDGVYLCIESGRVQPAGAGDFDVRAGGVRVRGGCAASGCAASGCAASGCAASRRKYPNR